MKLLDSVVFYMGFVNENSPDGLKKIKTVNYVFRFVIAEICILDVYKHISISHKYLINNITYNLFYISYSIFSF